VVRVHLLTPSNGDGSSVGRAPVCGTGCRGFKSRPSPQIPRITLWAQRKWVDVSCHKDTGEAICRRDLLNMGDSITLHGRSKADLEMLLWTGQQLGTGLVGTSSSTLIEFMAR
jgi:hypothetical protein